MRTLIVLVALLGAFVLVAMTVAPSQPVVRDWYLANACSWLDQVSTDICAAMRRAASEKAGLARPEREQHHG